MSYKIVKDDKKFYQIMHPDGSKFTVPKAGLSKDVMSKISKYPKAFDGGVVGDMNFEKNSSSMNDDRLAMNDMTIPQNPATMMDTEPMPEEPVGLDKYPGQTPTTVVPEMLRPLPEQTAQMQPEQSQPVMPATDPQAAMFDQMKSGVSTGLNMAKKAGQEMRNELAQNQIEQKKIVDDFQMAKKDFDKATDENAKMKIDQGRFWSNQSTGNKILAGIGVALSGIGSGLTGQKNMALDIINKKIDQDIELQKKDKDSLYNANLQKFKSAEMAYNATKAAALGQVQNIHNNYTSKITDANMQQDMAKFNAQLGLMQSQLAQKTEGDIQNKLLMNKAVTGELPMGHAVALPKEYRELYIPGEGFATNPEGAKKIRELQADKNVINNSIDQILEIVKNKGTDALPTKDRVKAKTLATTLVGKFKSPIVGSGTLSDTDMALIKEIAVGDPLSPLSIPENTAIRLSTGRDLINRNYSESLRSEGLNPKMQNSFTGSGQSGKLPSNKGKLN